ncbi:MAG TPA: hypothetical protein VEC60_08550 [Reyranella sp.]|nr:hypothetical protein [Reyranella sp.]
MERQFKRYHPRYQGAVRALAARHARIADLALSFPTLLFALAAPRRGIDPARALALAIDGAALAEVAAAADVPLWLRRFPPEALACPLAKLPNGKAFRRRIANHLPSRKVAPVWLKAVSEMAELADEPIALWIAGEIARDMESVKLDRLRRVGLWAWFSKQFLAFGSRLTAKRWEPNLRFRSALDAADDWHTTIELHLNLGREPIADPWLRPAHVCGYDFQPLSSASAIAEEAAAMRNCLRTYGGDLAHNGSRLWSMRRNGQRVATLRVAFWNREPLPNVVELKGPENAHAPLEVWWAARQWLNTYDVSRVTPQGHRWGSVPLDRATWISLWRPYWVTKGRIPAWLPLAPSRRALEAL